MQIVPINSGINFKENKVKKEKKDPTAPWARKKCIVGGFGLSAALINAFVANPATDAIIKRKKITTPYANMKISSAIGILVLSLGTLLGYAYNAFDEKHQNTKLGNFFYKLFNGPKGKIDNNAKN